MDKITMTIVAVVGAIAIAILLYKDYRNYVALKKSLEDEVERVPFKLMSEGDTGELFIIRSVIIPGFRGSDPSIAWIKFRSSKYTFQADEQDKALEVVKNLTARYKENGEDKTVWPTQG